MFSKVLIFALAVTAYALPATYVSKNIYGTGLGYGANLGRVATLGNIGYGSSVISGVPAVGVSTYGTGLGYGIGGYGLGGANVLNTGIIGSGLYGGYGLGAAKVLNTGVVNTGLVGGYGLGAAKVLNTGLVGTGLGLNQASYGLANLNIARGVSVNQAGPVNAAVQTVSRTVDYRPVPYTGDAAVVQDIDVPPQESPLRINFQSKSSPLSISQGHIAAEPGQVQVTHSEDEPQTAIHNVNRPIVQQVNEVIQPYRTLTQTVEPVIEQAHTNIAQGEGVRLTGLTSGVIGGTGVIGASGLGVTSPALVGGLGVARYGVSGLSGYGAGLGYGVRSAAVAPAGLVGIGGLRTTDLVGGYLDRGQGGYTKVIGSGLGYGYGLNSGVTKVIGSGLGYGSSVYDTGLGYGSSVYGTGLGYGSSVYGTGLGYNSGLDLTGLSGLSTSIRRF